MLDNMDFNKLILKLKSGGIIKWQKKYLPGVQYVN